MSCMPNTWVNMIDITSLCDFLSPCGLTAMIRWADLSLDISYWVLLIKYINIVYLQGQISQYHTDNKLGQYWKTAGTEKLANTEKLGQYRKTQPIRLVLAEFLCIGRVLVV